MMYSMDVSRMQVPFFTLTKVSAINYGKLETHSRSLKSAVMRKEMEKEIDGEKQDRKTEKERREREERKRKREKTGREEGRRKEKGRSGRCCSQRRR